MPAPLGPEAVCSPAAQEIIKHEAFKLTEWAGFNRDELDDLIQEITTRLLHKLPLFDPKRGHVNAFIRVAARSAAHMIARERRTEKRGAFRTHLSLSTIDGSRARTPISDWLGPSDGTRRVGGQDGPPSGMSLTELNDVVNRMPDELASVCRLLGTHSVAETARLLGIRRQRIYELIPAIRERLSKAGFTNSDV